MLQQLRSSTATIPFKLKPPSRQQLISWTKSAWDSLSAQIVMSGFEKAMIIPKQVRSAHLTNQNAFDAEPHWALLDRLLDEVPVIRHFVDPNRDIDTLVLEEDNVDNEA
ncbi:Extracellular dioxygenase [Phytophthora cinnamomi]|uniref:Extracellular dioxygenase n=1 Tax=Phytophthora cinnamomi TaxID=4785 RepID=UPI003559B5B3|nr:Extracellular dioxygenase [Phytophthora cinnamomi]